MPTTLARVLKNAQGKTLKPRNQADLSALRSLTYGLNPATYISSLGWNLEEWQQKVLSDPARRLCINGARQIGKSTITAGYACWLARFSPKSLTVILTPTKKQSQEDFLKIHSFIKSDPNFPGFVKDNQDEMAFTNESRILILIANEDTARGFSNPSLIIYDEASRIEDSVFNAVRPMITNNPYARITEISTPNGKRGFFYNHFTSPRWTRYQVRSPYEPYMTPQGVPDVRLADNPDRMVPEGYFFFSARHYNTNDQLEALVGVNGEMGMSLRTFRQEYCTEFVSAEDQVFDADLIEQMFTSESPYERFDTIPELTDTGIGRGEADPLFMPDYYNDRRTG